MKSQAIVLTLTILQAGLALSAVGLVTIRDSEPAAPPAPAACIATVPAWLPPSLMYANATRTGPLRLTLNPWMPWRLGAYPATNWTLLRTEAMRLYGVDLIVLNGTGPGGDILLQHAKWPQPSPSTAGRWENLPVVGGRTSSILVTWSVPNVTMERLLLHEIGHGLGLNHEADLGNPMFPFVDGSPLGLETNACQRSALSHLHRVAA